MSAHVKDDEGTTGGDGDELNESLHGREADTCQINVLRYEPLNKPSQQHLMRDVFLRLDPYPAPPKKILGPLGARQRRLSWCDADQQHLSKAADAKKSLVKIHIKLKGQRDTGGCRRTEARAQSITALVEVAAGVKGTERTMTGSLFTTLYLSSPAGPREQHIAGPRALPGSVGHIPSEPGPGCVEPEAKPPATGDVTLPENQGQHPAGPLLIQLTADRAGTSCTGHMGMIHIRPEESLM
ncbi:hypothetical protein NQZ68_022532 [Dissostichus eleginoides]|nr:hypothetical protein NQZ68_022532 [Dissostichus eleginoides]